MSLEKNIEWTNNQLHWFVSSEILFKLGISDKVENILDVFNRVANLFCEVEWEYNQNSLLSKDILSRLMKERKLIPSTTILMNAGRMHEASLSACTVPQINLKDDLLQIKKMVDQFHFDGMGTWFNFDDIENPIPIIHYLNHIGIEWQKNEKQLRPVGNMWVLSIDHPKLLDFINIKNQSLDKSWVFNFSVLIDDDNLNKIKRGEDLIMKDWKNISSHKIMDEITKSISISGEPGLIFIDKLNSDNQVPTAGKYKSLAPCGEVGLTEGETCQFSYINLGTFVKNKEVDYLELEQCTRMAVRFLDNSVEYNISRFKTELNKEVAKNKRRIGIGVCGFADLLNSMDIKYGSNEAIKIAENIFSFINYISKKESIRLSKERGPFNAFSESKYISNDNIIRNFSEHETETVSSEMWRLLDQEIKNTWIRNCSTIALPPTGRSSYIIWASPSIEPYFHEILSIPPKNQLRVISSIQKFVDDSISKTINVSEDITNEKIKEILLMAINSNLKWITIYRDKSRELQPQKI